MKKTNNKMNSWDTKNYIGDCADIVKLEYHDENKNKYPYLRCRELSNGLWKINYRGHALVFKEVEPRQIDPEELTPPDTPELDVNEVKDLFKTYVTLYEEEHRNY